MEKSKKKKIVLISLICLGVLVLVMGVAFTVRLARQNSNKDSTVYTVKKESIENVIEISGNISAAESQTLQAAGDGTIQKVYVKEGDRVQKGQILVELDAVEQRYSLAKQKYELEKTEVSGSRRELELMRTQISVLEQKIKDRMVYAYFDGIVVDLDVSEGDVVEAKDEVGTMINRDYMTAEVEVVENDVSKLQKGQKVSFTFPAYSDLKVEGYVEDFPAVGRITSRGATVVDATVRIDNPPEEILPNFSFTGKIEISPPEELLLVEKEAIGHRGPNIFAEKVLSGGKTEKVDVKVMPYDKTYVRIIEGVSENDVLKNQGSIKKSGMKKNSKNKGGMPGGMPGAGGPPPGM